jgi:hypothetical protein
MPDEMPSPTLDDILSPFGLSASMQDDGILLKSTTGLHCIYSARGFVPVVFPGMDPNAVAARLVKPGVGELRVNGQCYPVTEMLLDID